MYFGDRQVVAIYYGDRPVVTAYFGDRPAWTQGLTAPLRVGKVNLSRFDAIFAPKFLLETVQIELNRNAAVLEQIANLTGFASIQLSEKDASLALVGFADLSGTREIDLNREDSVFRFIAAKFIAGNIHLTRKSMSYRVNRHLSGGQGIHLIRKAATFGLVSATNGFSNGFSNGFGA